MRKSITFFVPDINYKRKNKKSFSYSIRLTDEEFSEIKKVCDDLCITPHYFMRWCVICSARAVKNEGKYKKLNVFGDD